PAFLLPPRDPVRLLRAPHHLPRGSRRGGCTRQLRARLADDRPAAGPDADARPQNGYPGAEAAVSDVQLDEVQPADGDVEFPSVLPVLPLKETVVFPQAVTPLAVGQERSVKLIDDVVSGNGLVALVTARDPSVEVPGWSDLFEVGTAAMVHRLMRMPDG